MFNYYIMLFLLSSLIYSFVSLSNPTSEGEMYSFDGKTFELNFSAVTKEKKNDNIFNLLSGFHNQKDGQHSKTFQSSSFNVPKYNIINIRHEDLSGNDVDREEEYSAIFPYSLVIKKSIQLANQLSDSGSAASDVLEDVISTVKKVTTIYDNELKKRPNGNDSMSLKNEKPHQHGIMDSASDVMNTLFLPENMEQIYKKGTQATKEDEILKQLASLIIGSEDRGGGYGGHGGGHYGLTKDPITIIALLALAAYLIRAAIEFLRATNGKRSLALFDYPGFSHLMPDVLSNVHALIEKAQLKYENTPHEESNDFDNSTWTSFILDILNLVLLQRKDSKYCFRKQLCNQLDNKSITELKASDALWIGIGMYAGDQDVLLDVFGGDKKKTACSQFAQTCYSTKDRNCESCPSTFRHEMKQMKKTLNSIKNLQSFNSSRNWR